MLSRDRVRAALIDHMCDGSFDFHVLSEREMLELVLHLLLEQRRRDLNTSGPPAQE